MPFTFSHPAIILPLSYLPKKWISLTALIVGSITPDFEYFLRMKVQSIYSHTLSGIFWFDLPLAIIISILFHTIVRHSLFFNLPKQIKTRLLPYKNFDWINHFKHNWIVVIISFIIGITSHLLWDSFTHNHGYFVEIIPLLNKTIDLFNLQVPVFKILQHSSSLIGAIILLISFSKLPINPIENHPINFKYWLIFSIITLIIITFRFLTGLKFHEYGTIIVTIISATIIGLIVTPVLTNKL
ncbi:protein of unknown function [Flavobacterium flevense]|uniref:DUF4184 domain-containing protein n=1 Tax=Flavobacterium flevense TaxID=983 RepID=A0A4Y4ARE4_9FLAO|nr:DUF4184 family protein [Flavobacterium flevense]GEC70755.1 hypothetical protein FFL01_02940 [Flavobacterium flevense]SHL52612.1 protein of unknown function [Flavobacterium flevense]